MIKLNPLLQRSACAGWLDPGGLNTICHNVRLSGEFCNCYSLFLMQFVVEQLQTNYIDYA